MIFCFGHLNLSVSGPDGPATFFNTQRHPCRVIELQFDRTKNGQNLVKIYKITTSENQSRLKVTIRDHEL